MKVGGYVCGDDYRLDGWWGDGVVRAVHEFLAAGGFLVHFLRKSQFMLRKL